MTFRLYDAHNHLHDERLLPQEGIVAMVVNGSREADWPAVLALARQCQQMIPSFGYHPWYVRERSEGWQDTLRRTLAEVPAGVGEIGLDRWVKDHDLAQQEAMFVWQLRLAAERNLPVSIHCLQAWGRLLEILRAEPHPSCGFVLHSYGGPLEMIEPLTELGAYFSLPGCFAHERKLRQRGAFRHVPPERLLLETDAPDQLLPARWEQYALVDQKSGRSINHPANLGAVYRFATELLGEPLEFLTRRVEENFHRLFGAISRGSG